MPTAKINGIDLYYELKGRPAEGKPEEGRPQSSEAVIFLNGLMSSVAGWALQAPAFEQAGYQVLLHDFRGQLLSEKPNEPYSFSQHALDLHALLDHLGIRKVHIVSTSYGALVGMRFAVDFPDHVKSIVMIDALPELDAMFRWVADVWLELLKEGDMAKFFRVAVPSIYSSAYLERNADKLREREAALAKLPKEYIESLIRLVNNTVSNAKLTAELSAIQCPVLLACGEHDILTPLKFSKLMQQQMPQAELVVIPECGHSAFSEKPDLVASLALGFIGNHL